MRILQLTSHLRLGGVPSYVTSLSEALRQRGHDVIVASEDGPLSARLRAAGAEHWHLPLDTSAAVSLPVLLSNWRLRWKLRRCRVDVIHAHTRVSQVVADALWRRRRIPYVTTWHGFFTPKWSRRWWPCTGLLTIAVSKPVAQSLRDDFRVPGERIRVVPNGVNAAFFAHPPEERVVRDAKQAWGLDDRGPVIGTVGRLASGDVKGLDLLVEAVRLLRPSVPDLQLLIVGDGPGRSRLEGEARRAGVLDRLRFAGGMQDVRVALAAMDVFAFPSRAREGFGLSLIEAMAAGKAVVASNAGAMSEIVGDGRSGWLAKPGDAQDLARCLQGLVKDAATRAALGREAQARVRSLFSLERMTDQVESVYRDAMRIGR